MKDDFYQRHSIYTLRTSGMSDAMFRIIIDISSIRSEKVINASCGYFANGDARLQTCGEYDVNAGYL